ncbi:short chain dehydrogenase [Synechococcus sp. CBW1002]|jgi:NAD(P)-dependent dehydrogenase (short-subunit alcohol dehydrogenase family)|uniref:short chain dehydrogenase n=1 Tax=Synechococcus sp. CBW1002 TaxID=1353134 RepID=UPI0018CECE5B|nr:short chain dehydrogenase [Synechococcus sp. CBW1002]QPN59695.1 short chain dehydrogenase [Synechococcus sp. CBW1002]
MRIVLIGAAGTIGQAVDQALAERHQLIRVSRTRGDQQVDIAQPESIRALFEAVAPFDAVVCAAGQAAFGSIADLSDDDFQLGLTSKLMGQVNLVRLGLASISDGGSFTLSSGVLGRNPVPDSCSISMVNAGLDAFTRAAALGMPRGVRINVVSPPWVRETLLALGRDPTPGLSASVVAKMYVDSVESEMTGERLDPRDYV